MKERMVRPSSAEYQASLYGAVIGSLGVGTVLAQYLQGFAWWLVLVGVILHGWGMYRVYRRKE